MVVEDVLKNIKNFREQMGYSHEYMAFKLGISQAAYSRLEKNKIKLTLERLFQISGILNTKVFDLLDCNNNVETIKSEILDYNRIIALYEGRLKDKDRLIEQLEKLIK